VTEYEQIQKVKYRSFESENEKWSKGQARFINTFMLPHFKPDIPPSILDCACGDGVGLAVFKHHGFTEVTGLEFEPEKAAKARVRYGYPVWEGDMHELALVPGSMPFHVVYSSHSLEHAHDPIEVLKRFHSVLAYRGWLFLVLPFPDRGPDDAHCGKYKLRTDQGNTTTAGLMDVLEGCGFKWEEVRLDTWREEEVWVRARKI
jgi:ubiquinone/menaquinone biosynthesis C-methylase UbiE